MRREDNNLQWTLCCRSITDHRWYLSPGKRRGGGKGDGKDERGEGWLRYGTGGEVARKEKKNVISIPRTFSVPIGELIESFK